MYPLSDLLDGSVGWFGWLAELVGCSTWFGPDAGVTHRVGYSWVTPEESQGGLLH